MDPGGGAFRQSFLWADRAARTGELLGSGMTSGEGRAEIELEGASGRLLVTASYAGATTTRELEVSGNERREVELAIELSEFWISLYDPELGGPPDEGVVVGTRYGSLRSFETISSWGSDGGTRLLT